MLLIAACEAGDPDFAITQTVVPARLGETDVQIVVHESGAPGLTYFNMHDDESTSVEAVLDVMRRRGGRLVELRHTGERNLRFRLGDALYAVDPNRIFTDAGARATLDTLSTSPPDSAAFTEVRRFADSLLGPLGLDRLRLIVTLHNNTDERYSALSYLPEGPYARDARFVYIDDDRDPDDFFFVTGRELYDAFRQAGFNAVLQDNAAATDDGSLSVYAAQAGKPYVNVEAQHGHRAAQIEMLLLLNDVAEELGYVAAPAG